MKTYRTYLAVAIAAGALADTSDRTIDSLVTDHGRTAQKDTITVDTAANDTAYTVTIDGVVVSITSDASATKAEIADALAAAINAEPLLSGRLEAVSDGVDAVTIDARFAGVGWTLTSGDANLTVATSTANAEPAGVTFGVGVLSTDGQTLVPADQLGNSAFTATPAVANDTEYEITVQPDSGPGFTLRYLSDADATAAEILAGLSADVPSGFTASDDGTSLTITCDIAGVGMNVILGTDLTLASQTQARVEDALAGFVVGSYEVRAEDTGYGPNDEVPVMRHGRLVVQPEAMPANLAAPMYLRVGGSGVAGAVTATPDANTVPIPRRLVRWHELLDSTFAVIDINCR